MDYPEPVKITNESPLATAYRNMQRPGVDEIFARAEKIETELRYAKNLSKDQHQRKSNTMHSYKNKARQLWRKIITESNQLN